MFRLILALSALGLATTALAEDLYRPGSWPALATDRRPGHVGDIVTVVVSENAQASKTVGKGSRKRTSLDGSLTAGATFDKSATGTLGGNYEGEGQSSRSDRVVAQLSATVFELLPNGDLRISGMQRMHVNGEQTIIKVSGRIRRDDISSSNTVPSSRIADAVIEYNGRGFTSRSAKPGVVGKIFNYLGLM
jgi:flagellar L-ring protein FlgH